MECKGKGQLWKGHKEWQSKDGFVEYRWGTLKCKLPKVVGMWAVCGKDLESFWERLRGMTDGGKKLVYSKWAFTWTYLHKRQEGKVRESWWGEAEKGLLQERIGVQARFFLGKLVGANSLSSLRDKKWFWCEVHEHRDSWFWKLDFETVVCSGHPSPLYNSPGFHGPRDKRPYWYKSSEGPGVWIRAWSTCNTRRGWELELFSLGKMRLKGNLSSFL